MLVKDILLRNHSWWYNHIKKIGVLLWQLKEEIGLNVSGVVFSSTIRLLERYYVSYLGDLVSDLVRLKADGEFKPFYLLSSYFLYLYSLLFAIPQHQMEVD